MPEQTVTSPEQPAAVPSRPPLLPSDGGVARGQLGRSNSGLVINHDFEAPSQFYIGSPNIPPMQAASTNPISATATRPEASPIDMLAVTPQDPPPENAELERARATEARQEQLLSTYQLRVERAGSRQQQTLIEQQGV